MRFLEFVETWLPPPRLLLLGGLGVDISESSIKYVSFKPGVSGLSSLSVAAHGEVKIDSDILAQGEVKNIDKLAAALREVKRLSQNSFMHLSLPEERVYVFETEIDDTLSKDAIRSQLEFKLEENVPLSPRDAYFDFRVLPNGNESHKMATVTVCAKEIVDAYYNACKSAGVTPLSFEVESQAVARAVLPKSGHGTHLLLDFGKTRTGLGIVSKGTLTYASTIDIGGEELSQALTKRLGEKDESEFTKIKNEIGLTGKGNGVAEALLPVVSSIKDEVQTRIQYWNDKGGLDRQVESIILCGGSANLRGLTTYFTETLSIECKMGLVWQNAFDTKLIAPPIDKRHSYGYATAIGLALSSFH